MSLCEDFSSLDSFKRDSKIFLSVRLCSRWKKKRVGFSPPSIHRAHERTLAPLPSLLMTASKALSSLFTLEIWLLSPATTADFAVSNRLVREMRSERSCLRFREEKSIQVRRIWIFKLSHQPSSESNRGIFSFSEVIKAVIILIKSLSERKEQLNFQTPLPCKETLAGEINKSTKSWSERGQGKHLFPRTDCKREEEI